MCPAETEIFTVWLFRESLLTPTLDCFCAKIWELTCSGNWAERIKHGNTRFMHFAKLSVQMPSPPNCIWFSRSLLSSCYMASNVLRTIRIIKEGWDKALVFEKFMRNFEKHAQQGSINSLCWCVIRCQNWLCSRCCKRPVWLELEGCSSWSMRSIWVDGKRRDHHE